MSSHKPRYIHHHNHPPSDLSAVYQDILRVLGAEVKRVQNHVPKTRKGSVYVGITGSALVAHHLSSCVNSLPGLDLTPTVLLSFTDARLTQALSFSPTSLSSPSSGSHSSFLETAVGIATLILVRAITTDTFGDSWTACAQLIESATQIAVSEDRRGCEVLYRRAGLLYALLRLRSASRGQIKPSVPVTTMRALSSDENIHLLVQSIVRRGESGADVYAAELAGKLPAPPLMWTWHGKRYLGAAHGVAGILHVLLLCPADIVRPYTESILSTVEWLIGCQAANGNWPSSAPTSDHVGPASEKELAQWCHGASGILMLLCTVLRCARPTSAPPLLGRVITSVQAAAALVYRRGLLSKGVGLCHGVAGSVFALLAVSDVLDRARICIGTKKTKIGEEDSFYLARAAHFVQLAAKHESLSERGEMAVPDHLWSLYEGLAGMCCAWAEVPQSPQQF